MPASDTVSGASGDRPTARGGSHGPVIGAAAIGAALFRFVHGLPFGLFRVWATDSAGARLTHSARSIPGSGAIGRSLLVVLFRRHVRVEGVGESDAKALQHGFGRGQEQKFRPCVVGLQKGRGLSLSPSVSRLCP